MDAQHSGRLVERSRVALRSRLSYYSVAMLAGLAVVSALVLVVNPFGPSANASPGTHGAATSTSQTTAALGSGPFSGGNTTGAAPPLGEGHGWEHNHDNDGGFRGVIPPGNYTSTTTTSSIYAQNE